MDKCLDLSVIPQFGGTCWFNAILTIALYSQNTRKVLLKQAKKWDKKNKFLMIIKSILVKYYNEPKQVQKFFNKIKPEIILFKMFKTFNDYETVKIIKKNIKIDKSNIGWYENYIITFFKYLNINCLDIIYSNGKYILNFDNEVIFKDVNGVLQHTFKNPFEDSKLSDKRVYKSTKKILEKIPDVIFVMHQDLNSLVGDTYMKLFNPILNSKVFDPKTYNCKIKGVDKYEDIIYVNGHKYKLDAVTLLNYDTGINNTHAIAGITCNKNRYVYNGWQSNSTDPAFQGFMLKGNETSPCSLMKYEWDLKKDDDFCLNLKGCQLDFFNKFNNSPNLCFSFGTLNNKARRILVYVRASIEKTDERKISIPSKLNISNISGLIKDIHDIKKMNEYEIALELHKMGVYLIPDIHYTRETLENLYYEEFKKYYNIDSSSVIQKKKKESNTKDDLIKNILDKYPNLKNLKTKTKDELKEILNKGLPKDKTKEELIAIAIKKVQKLSKTKLEKLIAVI